MKTILTLLATFSLFYFASSCKKGDTGSMPGIDSTHYYDSVKHVTDSIKNVTDSAAHVADSIFKSPYGIYYGTTVGSYHIDGNSNYATYTDTLKVTKIGNLISIISIARGGGGYSKNFPFNASGHYFEQTGSGGYIDSYEATIGTGILTVHVKHEEGSPQEHDNSDFEGGKKK